MGEMAEDFGIIREHHRQRKEKNRNAFAILLAEIKRLHHVRQITEYQYRIDGKIDIYPSNHKYHILKTGKRGHYNSDIKSIEALIGGQDGRSIR